MIPYQRQENGLPSTFNKRNTLIPSLMRLDSMYSDSYYDTVTSSLLCSLLTSLDVARNKEKSEPDM